MRHLLPSRMESAVFALVATFCSGIVMSGMIDYDLMLSMLALPLFVCAAVMGLRRSPQWAAELDEDETDENP